MVEVGDATAVAKGEAQDKFPSQLSGDMQQRIAVAGAMAMVMNADPLLIDGPFGAIDPKLRSEV